MWCFSCGAAICKGIGYCASVSVWAAAAKQQDSADENSAYSLLGPVSCLDKPCQKCLSSVKLL